MERTWKKGLDLLTEKYPLTTAIQLSAIIQHPKGYGEKDLQGTEARNIGDLYLQYTIHKAQEPRRLDLLENQ